MQASKASTENRADPLNKISFVYTALSDSLSPHNLFTLDSDGSSGDVIVGLFNFDFSADSKVVWHMHDFSSGSEDSTYTQIGPMQSIAPEINLLTDQSTQSFTLTIHLLSELKPGDYELTATLQVDGQQTSQFTTYFAVKE